MKHVSIRRKTPADICHCLTALIWRCTIRPTTDSTLLKSSQKFK